MADHHVKQMRKLMPFTGATMSYLDVKKIAKRLDPDEDCLAATVASIPGPPQAKITSAGVICATTRRLIFASGLLPPFTLQEFPYPRISAIDFSQLGAFGVGKGVIRVNSGGAVFDFEVFDTGGAQRVADAVRQQLHAPQAPQATVGPASPTASVPVEDPLTMLEALSSLHAEELVTDEEFEVKKHDLLARM